ncbi:MAG: LacI family DNA-binding transcriptional regulator [Anaerolineae bacterium]|nr:LacI family DNA-binding transcriptional regulator [Anaerolineae bacterium]
MDSKKREIRTIADIAQLAGVSKSTVSRALRNSSLISEKTKARIQKIAQEHNFQIHQVARNLSMKKSQTIGFVLPIDLKKDYFITDPFHLEIVGAISGALADYNYDLLLAQIEIGDHNWPYRYLDAGRVDGFILTSCTQPQKHIQTLIDLEAPFIVWGNPLPGLSHCSITSDDLTGSRQAVQHLISRGRQRIAFLGGTPTSLEVKLRYQGYETALKAAGKAVNPNLITYGDYTSHSGSEAMQRLIKQAPDLDAVFVNSDLMAIAAIGTLRENGYQVPEDIAIVGYDDISLAAHCAPPLTTIRQNIQEAGKLLVHNLMQYIETGIVTNVTMPVELIVRQSSGVIV